MKVQHKSRPHTRSVAAAAGCLSLLLAVTACGSSSDTGDTSKTGAADDLKLVKAGTLTLIATNLNPPTSYVENGKLVGFTVEMARLFAASQGLKAEERIVGDPNAGFAALTAGQGDIGVWHEMVPTPERKERFEFAHPSVYSYWVWLAAPSGKVKSDADLQGATIGVVSESVQHGYLKKSPYAAKLKIFDKVPSLAASLAANQVDVAFVGASHVDNIRKDFPKVNELYRVPSPNPAALPMRKGNTKLVEAFNVFLKGYVEGCQYFDLFHKHYPAEGVNTRLLEAFPKARECKNIPAGDTQHTVKDLP